MTELNVVYLAMVMIAMVELRMYWSVELNTVYVAAVVHSKMIEDNTCGGCTSSA